MYLLCTCVLRVLYRSVISLFTRDFQSLWGKQHFYQTEIREQLSATNDLFICRLCKVKERKEVPSHRKLIFVNRISD